MVHINQIGSWNVRLSSRVLSHHQSVIALNVLERSLVIRTDNNWDWSSCEAIGMNRPRVILSTQIHKTRPLQSIFQAFGERSWDIRKELLFKLLVLPQSQFVHFFLRLRDQLVLKLRGHLLTLGLQLSQMSQVLFCDLLIDLKVLDVYLFEELFLKLCLELWEETYMDGTKNDTTHRLGVFLNDLAKFLLELNDHLLVDKHELLRQCLL